MNVTADLDGATDAVRNRDIHCVPAAEYCHHQLPSATPTYIYHTQFQASGGVAPLNWSLASGTLPTGMILNSAGILFRNAHHGRHFHFYGQGHGFIHGAQWTALNTANVQPYHPGYPDDPTATLPNGTVGLAYTATLPSSGGLPPLAWSIYSGSLPSGLVLQKTGAITGTPTTPGTYSFEVTVVHSSPVQRLSEPAFTITINPSGPLALRTTSLVNGTVDVAYNAQLVATGGTPP